jgi:hypothetical protein
LRQRPRTLIEKVEQANARASAVTIDNARLRTIVERYMKDDPSDAKGAPETQLYKDATAAFASTPDAMVQEVRWLLANVINDPLANGVTEWDKRADALLEKLGGKP